MPNGRGRAEDEQLSPLRRDWPRQVLYRVQRPQAAHHPLCRCQEHREESARQGYDRGQRDLAVAPPQHRRLCQLVRDAAPLVDHLRVLRWRRCPSAPTRRWLPSRRYGAPLQPGCLRWPFACAFAQHHLLRLKASELALQRRWHPQALRLRTFPAARGHPARHRGASNTAAPRDAALHGARTLSRGRNAFFRVRSLGPRLCPP
mmetsp:Transcript_91360/g.258017  ORF Transcript_91360/g.258017 Transcript_91360/m.258017 type:complete len:203 (+) Transcript_91360:143-751(+)